ncbi:hypothetical protein IWZ03DRAFT_363151 [Phyllosticta citriasiana]|uniref:Uncharacterized protein n=1 Tax=Phyllosticta citriasiana TaxID=595635 RepID=A0ABR1KFG0_9PEZI
MGPSGSATASGPTLRGRSPRVITSTTVITITTITGLEAAAAKTTTTILNSPTTALFDARPSLVDEKVGGADENTKNGNEEHVEVASALSKKRKRERSRASACKKAKVSRREQRNLQAGLWEWE